MSNKVLFGGVHGFSGVTALEEMIKQEFPAAIFDYYGDQPLAEDKIIEVAKDADVIVSQFQAMTEKVYASLPNLKAYICLGIGVDAANVQAAKKYGVTVTNSPDYCTDEVASHAVAMLLACQRKLIREIDWLKRGNWGGMPNPCHKRLAGSTVGIFGFGKIARNVAKKLSGFQVNVIAYDPVIPEKVASALQVKLVDFSQLLAESDFITLHAPALPSTIGAFNQEAFNQMKSTAYIINTARGALINTSDLYQALANGVIAGVGLDVLENEPPGELEMKLMELPNVIVTGHAAFYSDTAFVEQLNTAAVAAGKILKGEKPTYIVV